MRLKAVVNLSDSKPQTGQKNYVVAQTVMTFGNLKSPPCVGGSKSDKRRRERKDTTSINVVSTDTEGFSKEQQLALYKSGMLSHIIAQVQKDMADGTLPNVTSTPDNVHKFTSPSRLAAYRAEKKEKRAKANKPKSSQDIRRQLGTKVKRRIRKSWC